MANQAAKKAQKAAEALSKQLIQWIVPIHIFFILYRIVWWNATFTNWHWYGYGTLALLTYGCFQMLIAATQDGGTSEYALDVIIITLIVQVGVAFSDYFYYLFLVIPAYGGYCAVRRLLTYVFTPDHEESEQDQAAALKRQEKAARKSERKRFRTVRR